MMIFVGLGNPDAGAAGQRHNVGFMALDALVGRGRFTTWRARFRALVAEGTVGGTRVLAMKPQTYMNGSGEAVQAASAFYKTAPGDITVFHDELDLLAGRVRVKLGGGAAGHNGLRSIDRMLGSQDYWRVRMGIGHPGSKDLVLGHVLGNFAKAEQPMLQAMLDAVSETAPLLVSRRAEDFMTRVALLTQDVH